MRWTPESVREALGVGVDQPSSPGRPPGVGEAACSGEAYAGVCTDTRVLRPGDLFVALRGERFDAHALLGEAVGKGAAAAVVERVPEDAPPSLPLYVVDDSLDALGRLARYRRRHLSAPVCAIAGANGKTSTKELARTVLGTRYRVHATAANLNNLVGTPLTLLSAPDEAEAVVVEVGTNAPGEIARLRDIVEPDVAIITNVGAEHLEGLGSLEGVLAEETSLLEGMPARGVALVGDAQPELAERARSLAPRVRVAGTTEGADADLRADDVGVDEEGRVRFHWRGGEVRLGFRGRHNATNALLALGLGEEWGVDLQAASAALAALAPQKLRSEIVRFGDLRVIADCYNSNPGSLEAAVDLLLALPRGAGRIAVLGTMRELGAEGARLHAEAARAIARAEVDLIVATGDFTTAFEPLAGELGSRLVVEADPVASFDRFVDRLTGREVVLLKGSRGVALERLLPRFEERFGGAAASPKTAATREG